jgi:hypothetical protein
LHPTGAFAAQPSFETLLIEARQILRSQSYNIQKVFETGDEVGNRIGVDRGPISSDVELGRGN